MLDAHGALLHLAPLKPWIARLNLLLGGMSQKDAALGVDIFRFLQLMAEMLNAQKRTAGAWLEGAQRLLEADVSEQRALSDIAAELGLPYRSFRERFVRECGVSPNRYRSLRRVEQAKELLRWELLTNADIAERLGFSDEFHFSRRFKKITGSSPSDYRRHSHRHSTSKM